MVGYISDGEDERAQSVAGEVFEVRERGVGVLGALGPARQPRVDHRVRALAVQLYLTCATTPVKRTTPIKERKKRIF